MGTQGYRKTDIGITTTSSGSYRFSIFKRICSKLGGGLVFSDVEIIETTVEELHEDYERMRHNLYEMLQRFANCNPEPEFTAYIDIEPYLGGIQEWLTRHDFEENRFFFHPDHLGSSSFITDADGEGYQHLQYMPFGETSVSQKVSWWSTPYQFTGKEKDDETGFNYFGARYYNSDLSIWLSVDPMADEFPAHSAYNYCKLKPLSHIDPDGRKAIRNPGPKDGWGQFFSRLFEKPTCGPLGHLKYAWTNIRYAAPQGRYRRGPNINTGVQTQSFSLDSRTIAATLGDNRRYKLTSVSWVGNRGTVRNGVNVRARNYSGQTVGRTNAGGLPFYPGLWSPNTSGFQRGPQNDQNNFNGGSSFIPRLTGGLALSGLTQVFSGQWGIGGALLGAGIANSWIPPRRLYNANAIRFDMNQRNQNSGAWYSAQIRTRVWVPYGPDLPWWIRLLY